MATFSDLGAHTGTLVALIAFFVSLCLALIGVIYKIMTSIALALKTDVLKLIDKVDDRVTTAFAVMESHRQEQESKNEAIRARQDELRTILPEKFDRYLQINGPGYKTLVDGINRIEGHLEGFIDDCRAGRCIGGRSK